MTNLTPTKADELFTEISHFITEARKMADEGTEPDLKGLDDKVRVLVTQIEQMPMDQFRGMKKHLDRLTAQLDELKASLQQQKDAIEEQINSLPNQQKAHNAYQRARVSGAEAQQGNKSEG